MPAMIHITILKHMLFILLLSTTVLSGLTYEDITRNMNTVDLKSTGMDKLTPSEQKKLNRWLEFSSPDYFIKVSRAGTTHDIKYVFQAVPFHRDEQPPTVMERYDLALVAVFRQEAPFLREFIEFHKMMGVQHFYFYNNASTDNYYEALREYIENGEVELFEWPVESFVTGQSACFTDAVERSRNKATWLILADTDIFHYPLQDPDLVTFLHKYNHPLIGGVVVNIASFGTCGLATVGKGELLTELLVLRENEIDPHIRSIVRPDRVDQVDNPHFARYKEGFFAVDENLTRNEGPYNHRKPVNKIKANHYRFRTEEFLYDVYALRHERFKAELQGEPLPRHLPFELVSEYRNLDLQCSQVEDRDIQVFIPMLRQRMFSF